jgi:hypothetical protein
MPNTSGYAVKTACASGCDFTGTSNGHALAAALNPVGGVACGTVLKLKAGQTYTAPPGTGGFGVFRMCDANHWIIIRSDAADSNLPPPGTRIGPSYSTFLPKLTSAEGGVVVNLGSASGPFPAAYVRLLGIEVMTRPGLTPWNCPQYPNCPEVPMLMTLGYGHVGDPSNHLIVDRSYIHGTTTDQTTHGVVMYAGYSAVIDSYITDIHAINSDANAILLPGNEVTESGPDMGPYKVQNNWLESASTVIFTGGGGNGNVSDLTARLNVLTHKLEWIPQCTRAACPGHSYAGIPWGRKNVIEFKVCVRCLIEGNIIENFGPGGFISPRSRSNGPRALADDITWRYNWARNLVLGFTIIGVDGEDCMPTGRHDCRVVQFHRMSQHDNLFEMGFTGTAQDPAAKAYQLAGSPVDVQVFHNTWTNNGSVGTVSADMPGGGLRFVFRDNLLSFGSLVDFDDRGCPNNSWRAVLTCAFRNNNWTWTNNGFVNSTGSPDYGRDTSVRENFFNVAKGWAGVKMVHYNGGQQATTPLNYQLCAGAGEPDSRCTGASPWHNRATDGKDLGADVVKLEKTIACVIGGLNCQ